MKTKLLSLLALLLVAVSGAWAQGTYTVTFKANGNTKVVENVTLPKTFSCDYFNENGELDLIIKELYGIVGGFCYTDAPNSSGSENVTCGIDGDNNQYITVNAPFDGTATVTGKYTSYDASQTIDYSLEITCPLPAPAGFTASFTAANAYTIEGGKASVSVDGGKATLDEEGKLPDINEGQTVTITAKPGYKFRKVAAEKEAAPEPEGDFVTFSDGTNTVKVATMNLGATSVADGTSSYGDYYACGATETFGTVAYTAYNEGTVTATKDGGYSQDNAPADFADVVTAKMGAGYRMPTKDDFKTLYAACGGTGEQTAPASISSGADYAQGIYWVAGATSAVTIGGDEYKANGVLFVQDATHHVFFPAAGYVEGTQLSFAGDYGFCWSSSLFTDVPIFAYNLFFRSSLVNLDYQFIRSNGLPVRPFKD